MHEGGLVVTGKPERALRNLQKLRGLRARAPVNSRIYVSLSLGGFQIKDKVMSPSLAPIHITRARARSVIN